MIFVAAFIPFFRGGEVVASLGPLDVSREGLEVLGSVAAKATIGTVSAVLLGATTSVPAIIRGLEAMRVPRLLTLIAAFMYRYLFVIAEELRRMRSALASRAYRPRNVLQVGRARTDGHRAVPAHLLARRAHLPGDARAGLQRPRCRASTRCASPAPTRSSSARSSWPSSPSG